MVDDTPDDLVFELHNEALWGAHPYGYSILGTRDTVVVAQRRRICARCTSARTTRAHGRRRAGQRRARRAARRAAPHRLDGASRAATRSRARSSRRRSPSRRARRTSSATARRRTSSFGTPTVAHGDPRRYAMSLREHAARRRHELAPVPARARGARPRVFRVHVPVVPRRLGHAGRLRRHGAGDRARGRCDAIRAELARARRAGFPDDELAPGKSQLKGQITLSLESVVVADVSRAPASSCTASRIARSTRCWRSIDAVDVGDRSPRSAAHVLRPGAQTVVTLGPGDEFQLTNRDSTGAAHSRPRTVPCRSASRRRSRRTRTASRSCRPAPKRWSAAGHEVLVEKGAGEGSGFADDDLHGGRRDDRARRRRRLARQRT